MEKILRLYSSVGDNKSENIIDAVMRNDCIYIIKYYNAGKDIMVVDEKKENLLHKASRNDNYEVVDLLIKLGVDLNAKNRYGDTPLHLAVQFKNSDTVDKLIFEGANINIQNKKKVSPLHIAASIGNEYVISMLLDHGAKINIADENGMHPIHYAVKSGKRSIIRSLLNCGASLVECDDRKNNVLHHAAESGNDELVIYILRHMLITDSKNIYGQTPLHLASKSCSIRGISALVQAGYNLELKDVNRQTPYDIANNNYKTENANFINEFLNSKEYRQKFTKYKLHRAVCMNNYQYLYEKVTSNNVNDFDYFGRSLMYYAITLGYSKIVELLYKRGARLDNIDEYNQSALLIAIYTENIEIVKYLIKYSDVNEIFYNRSYLYRAILRNNLELVALLVENGANVNYVDNKHRTIYSYAIEYADDEIIEILLDNRATLV